MRVFEDITSKHMSRGEFLRAVGIIAFGIFGISSIMANVRRSTTQMTAGSQSAAHTRSGFGSGKFGV